MNEERELARRVSGRDRTLGSRLFRVLDFLGRTELLIGVIWCSMLFFAVQASIEGLSYIFGSLEKLDVLFRDKYSEHIVLVRTHALSSASALCLGLFAFVQETRRRKIHVALGRLYGLAVLVGGATSVPMALMAEGGWSTRFAFLLQGVFWIASLCCAIAAARKRNYQLHRRFMVRNYALTYSAVISRLLLHGLQESGLGFLEIYPVVSWTWVLGLALGEWWIWYSARLRIGGTAHSPSRRNRDEPG